MKLITLRLPEDLLEIINDAAQEYYGGDRSKMMREILWAWVEKQGDKNDKPIGKSNYQVG